MVWLEVADSGCGMSDEVLARCCEPASSCRCTLPLLLLLGCVLLLLPAPLPACCLAGAAGAAGGCAAALA